MYDILSADNIFPKNIKRTKKQRKLFVKTDCVSEHEVSLSISYSIGRVTSKVTYEVPINVSEKKKTYSFSGKHPTL